MSTDVSPRTLTPRRGWMARWFSREGAEGGHQEQPAEPARRRNAPGRHVLLLRKDREGEASSRDIKAAWSALRAEMALLPGGVVPVVEADGSCQDREVPAFYLDRH